MGSAPTLANMMAQTAALPQYRGTDLEILNVEREAGIVFATDEFHREVPAVAGSDADRDVEADAPATEVPAPVLAKVTEPELAPAAPAVGVPADIEFSPSDATAMLIALWTKVRPDQMTTTDSIETLVEGVSSRRNSCCWTWVWSSAWAPLMVPPMRSLLTCIRPSPAWPRATPPSARCCPMLWGMRCAA